jgi:glycosyltransferase involved in cell wall biosynthesis
MKPGLAMRVLKSIERFAYKHASHIVSASDAFLPRLEACGAAAKQISVVTNGVDLTSFTGERSPALFRGQHGLEDKFVAAYVGTHGMAHQLEIILEAADRLRSRTDILFLLVGDGAERERLVQQCRAMNLPNVRMVPQMPRERVPDVWAAADAAIVTLRSTPLFELVIPSKMFEAMAMCKPIILGVRGKAQQIVENGNCGLTFPPGDSAALADLVVAVAQDTALARRLGENGRRLATTNYDRGVLANRYLAILEQVVSTSDAGRLRRRRCSEPPDDPA